MPLTSLQHVIFMLYQLRSLLYVQISQFLWHGHGRHGATVSDRLPGPAGHRQTVAPAQTEPQDEPAHCHTPAGLERHLRLPCHHCDHVYGICHRGKCFSCFIYARMPPLCWCFSSSRLWIFCLYMCSGDVTQLAQRQGWGRQNILSLQFWYLLVAIIQFLLFSSWVIVEIWHNTDLFIPNWKLR